MTLVFTTAEVAADLKVSQNWIRQEVRNGRVTPLRIGEGRQAQMRFTQAHVDQLLASLQPAQPVERIRRHRRRLA